MKVVTVGQVSNEELMGVKYSTAYFVDEYSVRCATDRIEICFC